MMMMKNPVILATCLMLLSSLAVVTSDSTFGPDKCCFKFCSKPLKKSNVVSFSYTDHLCPMQGVLFKMRKGTEICASLSQEWVLNLMKVKERTQTTAVNNSTTSG